MQKSFINIIITLLLAAICLGGWAYFNRPVNAPDWPDDIFGFSYSPYRANHSPYNDAFPTDAQIREDLSTLTKFTDNIRIYASSNNMQRVPPIAQELGLSVILGVWLNNDPIQNQHEIQALLTTLKTQRNIRAIFVGNEALHRKEVSLEQLIHYLDEVRSLTNIPVSTAEPWHVWLDHPELADHVDVIAAHILPFWERDIAEENAVLFVLEKAKKLRQTFENKALILAEVGWPSHGRVLSGSNSSRIKQAVFLRTLVNELNHKGYKYFVIEAFDQPWKSSDEGDVGAYWGVFNAERIAKFPFIGPVIQIPKWRALAVTSIIIALFCLTILLIDSSGLQQRGRIFLAILTFFIASFFVLIGYDYSLQYLSWFEGLMGILLTFGALTVFLILLVEAHEMAEAMWVKQRRRVFQPITTNSNYLPKVSIHIPCYNEPSEMVIQTLNALANLDYSQYEVLVIDNNTKNENIWKPIEEHCKKLGNQFCFFHIDVLEGYKAGALNFALSKTDPTAEIIAVIDSDYCVNKDWLKHLVPHFKINDIAIVQNPQDYRDQHESLFKKLCYAEYQGFFHIGMITRNDRNAIIQHGTMTMIRHSLLKKIGWAQWCITEDAELGLRIFEHGLSAAYVSESYGKGLMPDRFRDYKKQRFRWAYGAMQIIKQHSRSLFLGKKTQLTSGQRYHFLAGWLPWMADGLNLFFTIGALFWSTAMLIAPERFLTPAIFFSTPPLCLLVFKLFKVLYLYKRSLKVSFLTALGAAIAGLSLSHTIAKAIIYGTFTKNMPFFRTSKYTHSSNLIEAIIEVREELFLLILLWGAAISIAYTHSINSIDNVLWMTMLLTQSLSYLSAFVMAYISTFKKA
jgi:exo-beta-1,3-glucanase (GH17 family)/cellulose synthase/poly-beta-1,6-N-acetylglucosamine synthase-like glycosyltransferase